MPIEIPVIKEVIIGRLSADDEVLSQVFSISENLAGDIRREMKWFPKYAKGLQNGGINVDIETFREYFTYRNSHQWKKEWADIKKRKEKIKMPEYDTFYTTDGKEVCINNVNKTWTVYRPEFTFPKTFYRLSDYLRYMTK